MVENFVLAVSRVRVRHSSLNEARLQMCRWTLKVTKRRSSWACIGNPKLEKETIEGTHAQETPAYQRRPTTRHEVQGSNPPIRALYMQLAKIADGSLEWYCEALG